VYYYTEQREEAHDTPDFNWTISPREIPKQRELQMLIKSFNFEAAFTLSHFRIINKSIE